LNFLFRGDLDPGDFVKYLTIACFPKSYAPRAR